MFELTKNLYENKSIISLIGSNITEYDIQDAGTTAVRFLKGDDLYRKIMQIPTKKERSIYIGKMMAKDNTLYRSVDDMFLKWLNIFIRENGISSRSVISVNRDSILLYDKIITKKSLEEGKVVFRTKNEEYSSFFRLNNGKKILFSRFDDKIKIVGVNKDNYEDNDFIIYILKPLLTRLEIAKSNNKYKDQLKQFGLMRKKYVSANNKNLYKFVDDNKFHYIVDGDEYGLDSYVKDTENVQLLKHLNMVEYIMPLYKTT